MLLIQTKPWLWSEHGHNNRKTLVDTSSGVGWLGLAVNCQSSLGRQIHAGPTTFDRVHEEGAVDLGACDVSGPVSRW